LNTDIDKNVCESVRVIEPQVCARCFWTINRELNIDRIKLLNLKKWHVRQHQAVRLTAGKWPSMQSRSARTLANINNVENRALVFLIS